MFLEQRLTHRMRIGAGGKGIGRMSKASEFHVAHGDPQAKLFVDSAG